MKLTVASSPHIRGNFRTNRIMLDVVLSLLPALAVGVWMLGIRALIVTLICVAAAVAAEWFYGFVTKTRNTVVDCSAMVTGLLLAMTLPASVPYWLAAVGSVVFDTFGIHRRSGRMDCCRGRTSALGYRGSAAS